MILLSILRLSDRAYGVMIGREIERFGKRAVSRAALYVALDRLEGQGLVSSALGAPTRERGGRAKRYFSVTATGLRAIQETQRAFVALWSGIRPLEDRPVSARQPPKLATFLMERLAGSDRSSWATCTEEFNAGRSRWWYWQEAFHAIAWSLVERSGAIQSCSCERLGCSSSLNGELRPVDTPLRVTVLRHARVVLHAISRPEPCVDHALLSDLGDGPWSMARLHPEVRVPATLAVAVCSFFSAIGDVELRRLWRILPEPRFVPYFVLHVLGFLVWLAALVVGGILIPVRSRLSNRQTSAD